ncbi:type I secretion system permease/ATPase [Paludibacterium yongneupense]|uniref:type I secretion system permease/ATPase n=1 Tax=Paludibacterium yongneupense TaxID=400061 RepID=UPI0004156A10|nr:type I secretion system permease/ATPase [Paludibacterium yongneupense]
MISPPAQCAPGPRPGVDGLRECLFQLASENGLHGTPDALTAGLPLVDGRLTPSLFDRAARRAGMSSCLRRLTLADIGVPTRPLILLLNGDVACLLRAVDASAGRYRLFMPGAADPECELDMAGLDACYSGFAILLKPRFRFELRAPEYVAKRSRHWFWRTVYEARPLYRDAMIAALLINLLALALPLVSMNVYDRVLPNMALDTLWVLAIGAALALGFDFMLKIARTSLLDQAGKRIDVVLSARIMEQVLGMRLEGRPASVGAFAANLRAFEALRDFIASASIVTLIDLPFVLLFMLVMAWISPLLALPALFGAILMLGQVWLTQQRVHDLAQTTLRASAQRHALLVESLAGLETIKALGAEGHQQARWERATLFLAQIGARLKLLSASSGHFAAMMLHLVYLATLVLGVYQVAGGGLSQGGLLALALLSGRVMAPLSQLVGVLTQYYNARTSLDSLEVLMALPQEREAEAAFFHRPHILGAIELRSVSLTYPASPQEALSRVSLKVAAGERVVIAGNVGSGKSSLQKLVMGLYRPSSGAILIDGIDMQQLDPGELRRHVAYVPQDIVLFYGTLRDNIAMGLSGVDDGAVAAAAELAGLAPFVNTHPHGFAMRVGERGETLSGGQRKAVGIARALLGNPSILLLDEPTGNLDAGSAAHIRDTLHRLSRNTTLLLVSHQPEMFDLGERLVILDRGRLVADGPREEVLDALRRRREAGRAA